MGAGDAPRSDVERRRAGPPIDSGRGPAWIGGAAKARLSIRPWNAVSSIVAGGARLRRASASARSGRRPVGSPFDPS
ncbi:unnamed protein product [Withania somnifera]